MSVRHSQGLATTRQPGDVATLKAALEVPLADMSTPAAGLFPEFEHLEVCCFSFPGLCPNSSGGPLARRSIPLPAISHLTDDQRLCHRHLQPTHCTCRHCPWRPDAALIGPWPCTLITSPPPRKDAGLCRCL